MCQIGITINFLTMLGCASYRIPSWCKPQHPVQRRGCGSRNRKQGGGLRERRDGVPMGINQPKQTITRPHPNPHSSQTLHCSHPPSIYFDNEVQWRTAIPTRIRRTTTNLLNVIFCQRLRCNIHSILLHLLAHISILNYSLSLFRHGVGFVLWLPAFVSICDSLIIK